MIGINPRHPGLLLAAYAALAGLIGLVAWMDRDNPIGLAALLLLPLLIQQPASRWGAFIVAGAYYAISTRSVPGITHVFFPGLHPVITVAISLGHAALLAAPWAVIGPRPAMSPWVRALSVIAVLVLLTVPPIGLFHWGSPLMVSGLLFPGGRWLGLAATVLLFALIAGCTRQARAVHVALGLLVATAVIANATYTDPALPAGWIGEITKLGSGAGAGPQGLRDREIFLAEKALTDMHQGYKVIVFPESISGLRNRVYPEIWGPVAERAKALGATVIIGREYKSTPHADFKNALMGYGLYGGDGSIIASSQVPMPIGDWKLGYEDGAETDIFGSDLHSLYGELVSFSVCYEDFLLWPHRGLFFGDASLLVSVANQWPSAGTSAERSQDISRLMLARLAGVPTVIARNT